VRGRERLPAAVVCSHAPGRPRDHRAPDTMIRPAPAPINAAVERREANVPIARDVGHFARASTCRSQGTPRVPRKHPSAFRRSTPPRWPRGFPKHTARPAPQNIRAAELCLLERRCHAVLLGLKTKIRRRPGESGDPYSRGRSGRIPFERPVVMGPRLRGDDSCIWRAIDPRPIQQQRRAGLAASPSIVEPWSGPSV
jgi:hypothetical protein